MAEPILQLPRIMPALRGLLAPSKGRLIRWTVPRSHIARLPLLCRNANHKSESKKLGFSVSPDADFRGAFFVHPVALTRSVAAAVAPARSPDAGVAPLRRPPVKKRVCRPRLLRPPHLIHRHLIHEPDLLVRAWRSSAPAHPIEQLTDQTQGIDLIVMLAVREVQQLA